MLLQIELSSLELYSHIFRDISILVVKENKKKKEKEERE